MWGDLEWGAKLAAGLTEVGRTSIKSSVAVLIQWYKIIKTTSVFVDEPFDSSGKDFDEENCLFWIFRSCDSYSAYRGNCWVDSFHNSCLPLWLTWGLDWNQIQWSGWCCSCQGSWIYNLSLVIDIGSNGRPFPAGAIASGNCDTYDTRCRRVMIENKKDLISLVLFHFSV